MASYTISPIWGAGAQLFDNSGNVLSGGKVYTYLAGTTTPATTYTTKNGNVANSNPIIANSAGRLTNEIWLPISQGFKFVLKDVNDVLLATYDNIPTTQQPPITNDASSISYEQGYEVTAGNFTIGATYLITEIGTTDFEAIGAVSNTVGVLFTATGVGSGTGKALYSRTVEQKLQESVSVKDFGATGDGVTDDTDAIQAAIDSLPDGGVVIVPEGIYRVSQIIINSFVTLKGGRMENGWARLITYKGCSIIRSLDNSGISPVKIENYSNNFGLQNLIIDANNSNQTAAGVHCVEHIRTADGDGYGGLIDGCKLINPTGYGLYAVRLRPLEISNCFIMNGIAGIQMYDTLITACQMDASSGQHPVINLVNSNDVSAVGNYFFGKEASNASTRIAQTVTVDVASNVLVVSDDTKFYDGMPVNLETTGTFPGIHSNTGNEIPSDWTFLAKKAGSNKIELWFSNIDASTGYRVTFVSAGTGTITLTSGTNELITASNGVRIRVADNRVAGSPGGAGSFYGIQYLQWDNNDSYLLNFNNIATQSTVKLIGCKYCNITNSNVGDSFPFTGITRVREAIYVADDSTAPTDVVSSIGNIFANNQYNLTQGLYINDVSSATYDQRNVINGWYGSFDDTVKRIQSPTYRATPGVLYYEALTTTTAVPDSTNTDLTWASTTYGNPAGITDGIVLNFPNTAYSLINVSGQLTITAASRPAGNYYVLVYVEINGIRHRVYWDQQGTNPGSPITIPFNVSQVVSTNAAVNLQLLQNSGSTMTLETTQNYSWIRVKKEADYIWN